MLPIALPRSSGRKCSRDFRDLFPPRIRLLSCFGRDVRDPLSNSFGLVCRALPNLLVFYAPQNAERCPSGLRSTLGKRVLGKLNRGFESHSLRHSVTPLISVPSIPTVPLHLRPSCRNLESSIGSSLVAIVQRREWPEYFSRYNREVHFHAETEQW